MLGWLSIQARIRYDLAQAVPASTAKADVVFQIRHPTATCTANYPT
jgi:hypothetical protein